MTGRRCWSGWLAVVLTGALAGCETPLPDDARMAQMQQRATDCLVRAARYEALATVRANGVEALQECGGVEGLPWIRAAARDPVPGVRFTAVVALGMRRDKVSQPVIERMLASSESSDRLVAAFALHRLGDTSHSVMLAETLVSGTDSVARRHAALLLGQLGEPGAIKLLARVMNDEDPGLRVNAIESMYLLGAEEAEASLVANAYNGVGAEESFAILSLARRPQARHRELYLDKLKTAAHLETRLAAARGLGRLGDDAGFQEAFTSLQYNTEADERNDPARNRVYRVRMMAALALGAIGDRRAAEPLAKMMNDAEDPRLQLAAAKALLDLEGPVDSAPFASAAGRGG